MSEETQLYLGFQMGSGDAESGFQGVLNYIREVAPSESHKGRFFAYEHFGESIRHNSIE